MTTARQLPIAEMDVSNLLSSIVVAIITATVTVWLSFRRFRSEKVWERKERAYSEIVDALQRTKHFFSVEVQAMENYSELPRARQEELRSKAEASEDEIRKAIDTGALLISPLALKELHEYWRKSEEAWDPSNAYYFFAEQKLMAVTKCLEQVIVIARHDLGITSFRENLPKGLFTPQPRSENRVKTPK
jgi:hypothetical protein